MISWNLGTLLLVSSIFTPMGSLVWWFLFVCGIALMITSIILYGRKL